MSAATPANAAPAVATQPPITKNFTYICDVTYDGRSLGSLSVPMSFVLEGQPEKALERADVTGQLTVSPTTPAALRTAVRATGASSLHYGATDVVLDADERFKDSPSEAWALAYAFDSQPIAVPAGDADDAAWTAAVTSPTFQTIVDEPPTEAARIWAPASLTLAIATSGARDAEGQLACTAPAAARSDALLLASVPWVADTTPPVLGPVDVLARTNTPTFILLPLAERTRQPVTVKVTRQPQHGTVSVEETIPFSYGEATYTPDEDFRGADSFEYSVTNGLGITSTATAKVTVGKNPGDAPFGYVCLFDGLPSKRYYETEPQLIGIDASTTLPQSAAPGQRVSGDLALTVTAPNLIGREKYPFEYTPVKALSMSLEGFELTSPDLAAPVPVAGKTVPAVTPPLETWTIPLKGAVAPFTMPADGSVALHLPPTLKGKLRIDDWTTPFTCESEDSKATTNDPHLELTKLAVDPKTSPTPTSPAPTTPVPGNRAPIALNVGVSTLEGTPLSGILPATDPDGDRLTYKLGKPSRGTVTGTAPALTYKPAAGFVGTDSFTYTVSDGKGGSATGTVTIAVQASPVRRCGPVPSMSGGIEPLVRWLMCAFSASR